MYLVDSNKYIPQFVLDMIYSNFGERTTLTLYFDFRIKLINQHVLKHRSKSFVVVWEFHKTCSMANSDFFLENTAALPKYLLSKFL